MKIEPMQPIVAVDWETVQFMRVTLEKSFGRSGGLRFRLGTTPARRNLTYDAKDRTSKTHFPGAPIMYPADAPAEADSDHASFIMPASMSATIMARDPEGHPVAIPDPTAHAAFQAFGFFMAPLEETDGLVGFTLSKERERVAMFWNWYRMPPGDGTQHPPMNRLGPPNMPHVALRPLNQSGNPIKIDGEEVVIRPREFFDFDNMDNYDTQYAGEAVAQSSDRVAEAIELLTKVVTSGKQKIA